MASTQEDEVEAARVGAGSFPRAVPEDNIEYSIFLLEKDISDTQRRDALRKIQAASGVLVKKHLKDYIWEQDQFQINLNKLDGVSYLQGRTSYGDSVEDEWLIVWLMVEVSKQFGEVWIRLTDGDGEFLLIEAANALPKWLNPEIADNRVWINKGHLHVIPNLKSKNRDLEVETFAGSLTLERALGFLGSRHSDLLSDKKIEKEAFFRLKKYPAGIVDSFHHTLIKLPRKVMFILRNNPEYISQAIEAFYLRDPIAMKPLQASNNHALIFAPTDLVTSRVKFTKIGFAKLHSQQFPYPPSWATISPSCEPKVAFQEAMGMKLTCGFEMLLTDPQNKDKRFVRGINLLLEDLQSGEEKLPTDEEIQALGTTEDDDSWLNIDFQDFEKELSGRGLGGKKTNGFGDEDTQEKLRKMVSRFEDLLAEDPDDSDIDEMDEDNDSNIAERISDNESHNGAEEDFNEMMREMLGMSKETLEELMGKIEAEMKNKGKGRTIDVDGESDDEEEIRQLSAAMEAELRSSGALKLDSGVVKKKVNQKPVTGAEEDHDNEDELSDEDHLDEDFNLARNMLESFKTQAGTAGPAGNLMSMLGMQLPRDEDDND